MELSEVIIISKVTTQFIELIWASAREQRAFKGSSLSNGRRPTRESRTEGGKGVIKEVWPAFACKRGKREGKREGPRDRWGPELALGLGTANQRPMPVGAWSSRQSDAL